MDQNEVNELILQKLTTIEAELKDIRTELSAEIDGVRTELGAEIDRVRTELGAEINGVRTELGAEINGVRTELNKKFSDVQTEVKETRQDIADLKVSDARTDVKLDTFIANVQERKADRNERWKIAGIVVSCSIAVVSLIISILS